MSKKRVYLVDDELLALEELKVLLNPYEDLEIIGANDRVEEAILECNELKPDLIFLDINMPGMNGFEVIKHLKEDKSTCDIPIVVLTGTFISEDDKKHGLTLGVLKYLTKPFAATDLVNEIKGALHAKNQDHHH